MRPNQFFSSLFMLSVAATVAGCGEFIQLPDGSDDKVETQQQEVKATRTPCDVFEPYTSESQAAPAFVQIRQPSTQLQPVPGPVYGVEYTVLNDRGQCHFKMEISLSDPDSPRSSMLWLRFAKKPDGTNQTWRVTDGMAMAMYSDMVSITLNNGYSIEGQGTITTAGSAYGFDVTSQGEIPLVIDGYNEPRLFLSFSLSGK